MHFQLTEYNNWEAFETYILLKQIISNYYSPLCEYVENFCKYLE